MKPQLGKRGVPIIQLTKGARGTGRTFCIHRLVLLAFVGPCPKGQECLHANDIPGDNRLINLRWGTRSENTLDKVRNGRHPMANKTRCKHGHKFTVENTGYRHDGRRYCKICLRRASNAYKARIREKTA